VHTYEPDFSHLKIIPFFQFCPNQITQTHIDALFEKDSCLSVSESVSQSVSEIEKLSGSRDLKKSRLFQNL
jgi:hypothetical protein